MDSPTSPRRHRTPDQILGPYFPTGHTPAAQADLTQVRGSAALARGEIIEITGRVLNIDGEPVRGIPVTIWQANTFGRYVHVNDPNPVPLDPHFVGCVGIRSGSDGAYRVKTVKPGGYPAGPDWTRPPHIHFEIHGQFERLITQMYFPGEPLNACDRLLNAALRPDLLIAKPVVSRDSRGHGVLNFDIVLNRG
jgi:protocatechuate 3,4-dioxygenase beta subunit